MTSEFSLLFLNAGRRVELVRATRVAFDALGVDGRIVTTDINGLAPALYLGDRRYILPHSSASGFVEEMAAVCRDESVALVVPLIDPDLAVLAKNRDAIESAGARVLVCDRQVIEICGDKEKTAAFLEANGFPTPKLYELDEARTRDFPLFLKPRCGSASVNTFKINTLDELEFFAQYVPSPVIQEYIDGDEITTDVFSDWSGEPRVAVPRRRLKVRAGEVSVGRVEENPRLQQLCMEVARRLGTVGPINVQAIISEDSIYVTEINPRFGGGSPLSMAAGAPLAEWMVLMALGRPLAPHNAVLKTGLVMMRYEESVFRESDGLEGASEALLRSALKTS